VAVSHETVHPLVRKLATTTCAVALLPISMGALVTTLKAGMAFADWPSSDGQNMLLYPWFSDFAQHPDKFVEHGHRLAGMLIGFISVLLMAAGWRLGSRSVRVFVTAILIGVIGQGLLGGARVILDRETLALTHSVTGGCFFSLCVVFRLACSPGWNQWLKTSENRISAVGAALVAIAPLAVLGQYVLGGFLRHLHMLLNEHLAGAAIVTLICLSVSFVLLRSGHTLLRCCGLFVVSSLSLQVALGLGSYLTRFGLPIVGYVATSGSAAQAVICSMHTVVGMFLVSSTIVSAVSVVRLYRAGCLHGLRIDDVSSLASGGTTA
jgi:cytochrome c oxidase assembly protein subunit 15